MYVLPTFGALPQTWLEASPWYFVNAMLDAEVKPKLPPFLIFNATNDLGLDHDGQKFWTHLQQIGTDVEYKLVERTTHATITQSHTVADLCKDFIHSKVNK